MKFPIIETPLHILPFIGVVYTEIAVEFPLHPIIDRLFTTLLKILNTGSMKQSIRTMMTNIAEFPIRPPRTMPTDGINYLLKHLRPSSTPARSGAWTTNPIVLFLGDFPIFMIENAGIATVIRVINI
jgi:hypothetical protein